MWPFKAAEPAPKPGRESIEWKHLQTCARRHLWYLEEFFPLVFDGHPLVTMFSISWPIFLNFPHLSGAGRSIVGHWTLGFSAVRQNGSHVGDGAAVAEFAVGSWLHRGAGQRWAPLRRYSRQGFRSTSVSSSEVSLIAATD